MTFRIEADGTRVVPLEKGYDDPRAGMVTELRLRPPTYRDFMALGDPTTLIVAQNAIVPQDDLATIKAYIERLADREPMLFEPRLTVQDALALTEAVKSFFKVASANTSTTSPTP